MKTNTTRNYTSVEINHIFRTINVSKSFLNKASKMGTKEYNALTEAMNAHPSYKIEIKVVEKKTYSSLTITAMRELIKTQPNAEEKLREFEKTLATGKAIHAEYPRAKKWMFENYGDVIRNIAESTEAAGPEDQIAA